MTCPTCGKPQIRRHRHGQGLPIRYGKFVADQERKWIRGLMSEAKARLERDGDRGLQE